MGRGRPSLAAGLGLVLGLAAGTPGLRAHDVWLEPSTFRPEPGDTLSIEVVVGEGFVGEPVPRRPARIAGFWFGEDRSRRAVRGVEGVSPAGLVRVGADEKGWYGVHYRSRPASVTLTAESFEAHLLAEGLPPISTAGQTYVRESYSRCVSALVAVGEPGALPAPPHDCELSLWPIRVPQASGDGDGLVLEVRRRGRPLAGAVIHAHHRGDPGFVIEAQSDASGRVRLVLPRSGVWLFKTIHLEPAREEGADWRSWWASLTFELSGS